MVLWNEDDGIELTGDTRLELTDLGAAMAAEYDDDGDAPELDERTRWLLGEFGGGAL